MRESVSISSSIVARRFFERHPSLSSCFAFDLQLNQAAVDLIERLGLRVDFHLHAGSRLIDKVNRLIREITVRDVAVRELSRSHNRRVRDLDAVMASYFS